MTSQLFTMTSNPLDWNIGETDNKAFNESKLKAYEENLDFLKAFSTESGKKVLEWMIKYTLESPTWWPGRPAEFGYFREGQNNLVRQLKSKVENARNFKEDEKNDRKSRNRK